MAGEYYRWLAKDVKPEEKRELTREEKIKNWWYYHKWHLAVAAVVMFLAVDLVGDAWSNYKNRPDYSIAYVGSSYLPEGAVVQLTEALEELGEDLNENGSVDIALHQYIAYPVETPAEGEIPDNYNALYAAQVQLAADLDACDSFIFLLEDPAQFQEDYQVLAFADGSCPEETSGSEQPLYFAWPDCPVLRELPLGDYQIEIMDTVYSGETQNMLSGLYIGRRGFWDGETCENPEGCEALWNKLIQGAAD